VGMKVISLLMRNLLKLVTASHLNYSSHNL